MPAAPRLAVVAIGTELTEGRIANTNAAWVSKRFLRAGVETVCHIAAPDDRDEMKRAFRYAAEHAHLVVVTGGLGPTVDDITRDVAAELAGVPLDEDAPSIEWLEAIFARLGRQLSPNNRRQALFPRGATILPNRNGTAPGFRMELCGARFWFVPGVPHESEAMLDELVLPEVEREQAAGGHVLVRRWNCFGLPESKVDALLAPIFPSSDPQLAFNISDGVVQIYLTARDADRGAAAGRLEAAGARVRETLGGAIFGEGEASLEEALLDAVRGCGHTLGFAESCTGGLAASRVTRIPGASDVFRGAVVAYANDVKRRLLDVPGDLIERHGAVSRECALAMARGVRRALSVSLGVAITGIAGPDGGSAEKPVGLVYVAVVTDFLERVREARLPGDRKRIQLLSAVGAIDQARRAALGLPEVG